MLIELVDGDNLRFEDDAFEPLLFAYASDVQITAIREEHQSICRQTVFKKTWYVFILQSLLVPVDMIIN